MIITEKNSEYYLNDYDCELSCYCCDDCNLDFAVDSRIHIKSPTCHSCGGKNVELTGDKLIGDYLTELA